MSEWILGRNPVWEVLKARRRDILRLRIAETTHEKSRLSEIANLTKNRKIPVEHVTRQILDGLGSHHQGVALEVGFYPYSHLSEMLSLANQRSAFPFILILDAIQDPQNLGTLLRTAEAVGVHGILLPYHHTAQVTPAVVHASAGACEHLLVAQVNLAQAITQLKEQNIWVIGLDIHPDALPPTKVNLNGPLALVVGNEGVGMRQLTRASCDLLVRLPIQGQVSSLNASVAGSIALYLAWQARQPLTYR